MRRHRFDVFSFLAGGLFTVLGVLYLTASLSGFRVDGRVVLPVTLIVLGAAGVLGTVVALARRRRGQRPQRD
jgi:hypothetical protein